ncbi:hypothetical protein [Arcticibacterium luteifluviistationis]|uniref:Uncharacterized protein n=1 Tax=Arcticibacterium luteifluviistationis TaxID=1784714 RepID=A0A2Z4G7Y7_9BACT|nr:hypothetical protein [Arcticibacterium luteifluviistationis]AWV97284.1 hypothetical protein DJ013_03510 [Arcticibacterium luteifluviistationis]
MDLNLSTIIIGLICIAVCVVPLILIGRGRKNKEQNKLHALTKIANQHEGRITSHAFSGDFGIAIDDKKGLVFFHKEENGQTTEEGIDLNYIEDCKLSKTTLSDAKNKEHIEQIYLCFFPQSENDKKIKWELFNRETNRQLTDELQIGEEWSKLINQQIYVKEW